MSDETTKQDQNPHNIFDRIFKRLMYLSSRAVITFINALFGTNHPITANLEYLSTELIVDNLKQWVGDILIRIDEHYKYWLEVQMAEDENMSFRIWNYSYLEGLKSKKTEDYVTDMTLVPAIVIYLESTVKTPDRLTFRIKDMDEKIHIFKYPVLKFLDYSIADLEKRNLVLLLPFYLLKLRKKVKSMYSSKRLFKISSEMKQLVEELGKVVGAGEQSGQLNGKDMSIIIGLMGKLYKYLYQSYPELEEVNKVVDDMLLTVVDEAEARDEARGEAKVIQARKEMAQYLIKEGWDSEKIISATRLDQATVQSLYEQFHL